MRLGSEIHMMAAIRLQPIDMAIIAGTLLIALTIGIVSSRRSSKSSSEFFLSGRGMPWWMLGFSMVATTFAADTPNLVTDIVRTHGVAGNWVWWAFLLTGMLTVFNYARLWRKSDVLTDLEFYEIRYGGKMAAMLRGFRAIYLGVLFNVVVMSIVMLAAIKMGQVMLGLSPLASITAASLVTIVFSTLGGFRGVVLTDCFLFFLAMVGSIAAAVIAVNHPNVGGLEALFSHELVKDKLDLIPRVDWNDTDSINIFVSILIVPLAVQWWSVWYPGSEPGGGGYLAQRMLAAKTPGHAVGATLLFNTAHYALRPWPWIIVALASLVVFPDIESLRVAFPQVAEDKLGHDLAYPAMLTSMPTGWLGIVLASLLAAYMSTISTHLNWGSSYIVNDFYHRFIKPEASERELVMVGRLSTIGMMFAAATLALYLQTASQGFQLILQIGAGTGLIFILRWYWWRINAWAEVVAMTVSFVVALVMTIYGASLGMPDWAQLCTGILITNVCWILAVYLLPSESEETLESFCRLIRPGGSGWKPVIERAAAAGRPIPPPDPEDNLPLGLLRMFFGCIAVYSALFATGMWLYGKWTPAVSITLLGVVAASALAFTYRKLAVDPQLLQESLSTAEEIPEEVLPHIVPRPLRFGERSNVASNGHPKERKSVKEGDRK